MSGDPAVKQRLLERSKALSELPKSIRYRAVTGLIVDALAFGVHDKAEIFRASYGDPSGKEYWEAYLSVAIPVVSLAYTLSAHLAKNTEDLEYRQFATLCAFRGAAEAGERWFVGVTEPLLAVEEFGRTYEGLSKVRVQPRAAVEWLLNVPIFEHLVPGSLSQHLQSSRLQSGVWGVDQQVSAAPESKSGPGAKTIGIAEAVNQLWPNKIPKGLSAKDRNKAILEWLRVKKYSLPTNPERAIQRVLRQLRSK